MRKWDGGKLTIDGEDMMNPAGKRRIRREWAYLEQNPSLNVNRTALCIDRTIQPNTAVADGNRDGPI